MTNTATELRTITVKASNRADLRSLAAAYRDLATVVQGEGLNAEMTYDPAKLSHDGLEQTLRNFGLFVPK